MSADDHFVRASALYDFENGGRSESGYGELEAPGQLGKLVVDGEVRR
jgi:hypothetical protein